MDTCAEKQLIRKISNQEKPTILLSKKVLIKLSHILIRKILPYDLNSFFIGRKPLRIAKIVEKPSKFSTRISRISSKFIRDCFFFMRNIFISKTRGGHLSRYRITDYFSMLFRPRKNKIHLPATRRSIMIDSS